MLTGNRSTMGDDYQLNLTTFLRHANRTFSDAPVTYRDLAGQWHQSDYGEEYARISQLAHALDELGIGPGSTVGVMDWNSRRHFELYFGVPCVAATMLQLNLRLAVPDLAYVVNHSQTDWVFVDESLLPLAEAFAPSTYVKGWVVLTDKPLDQIETSLENVYSYEELISGKPTDYDWQVIDENTAAYAGYTTGTTGKPKGVFYSHRGMYLHTMASLAALQVDYTDVVMPITPMFHVISWGFPQTALAAGAGVVLPGRFAAADITPVAEGFTRFGVTVANAAPALLTPLFEHFKALDTPPDLSGTRVVSGASEPPLALLKGLTDLTGVKVIHAYGATETTPLVTVNWHFKPGMELSEDEVWDLQRYQGLPVTGIDVKIVDPAGAQVPAGEQGEVLFRGPWITRSYHNLDDSAERFMDGWWRSGDAGLLTEQGYLKLTDRLKDVIKSGGEWISSIDMENALLDHPQVAEAAVIAVPDPKWDERPVAYVVAREDGVTKDSILAVLADRFAKWQLPDDVVFCEELPRTSVGKLDKKLLRSQHQQQD